MITRILGSAIGLLFWTLTAHMIPVAPMGIASATVSAAVLLAGLAQLGLGYGFVRHLVHAPAANGITSLGLLCAGLAAGTLAGLFLVGLPIWSPDLSPVRDSVGVLLLFALLVVGTSLSQLLHWLFLAKGRLEFSLIKQAGQALTAVLLLFILRTFLTGFLLPLTAYTAATLLSLIATLTWFLPLAQPGFRFSLALDRALRLSFARFSLANYLSDQFQRSPDALMPLVVITLFGPETGACFFVAWSLGRAIAALSGSVAESLFAESSRNPVRASEYVRLAALAGGGVATVLALLMSLAGSWVLSLYGRAYEAQGVMALRSVALAGVPGVCLLLLVNLLRLHGRLRALNLIIALNSGLGIAASYLGMIWFGFAGAGPGWLLAQLLFLAIAIGWYRWSPTVPPGPAILRQDATIQPRF